MKLFLKLSVLFFICILTCCGTNYEKKANNIEKALRFNQNYTFKPLSLSNPNYLLFNEEGGLFYFIKGNLDKSLSYFNNAKLYYQTLEESRKLKLEKALSYTIVSENIIPYEGSLYEKGLVHYYSGLAYLYQNNIDKAIIEFNAAENNQKFANEFHQKQIIRSENKITNFFKQNNLQSKDIDNLLEESHNIRAKVREKFANGNILYVAGLVKEITKSYNEALVNYKNAYTLNPNNPYILEDLYRLSLMYDYNYAMDLKKHNPILSSFNPSSYKQENTIYLIYEQGFIPKKENLKIPFIGIDSNLILTINLPIYQHQHVPKKVFLTTPNGTNQVLNQVLAYPTVNIYNLAKNQLVENYPIIIAKQVSKLASQIIGQKTLQTLGKGFSTLSIAFGGIYLFDSSDLRSWRTLPNYINIAKITTLNNVKESIVTVNGKKIPIDVSLNNGEVAVLHVFDTGAKIYTKVLYKYKK